tara:strand:- start:7962 stop:8117 length:156 start_codon:yes stop_codon:yes gene_type:complete
MDSEIVKDALEHSLSLINDELENVTFDDLRKDYILVINKIEEALSTLEQNG